MIIRDDLHLYLYCLKKYHRAGMRIILLALSSLAIISSRAQSESNNWYFGFDAGISFKTGLPVAISDGRVHTVEGVASISDQDGNLLFYTDGLILLNSQHTLMPNGTGLHGDASSTQSAVIVPAVSDRRKYYVFTVDQLGGPNGLKYSVVDMDADNGLGDCISKNVPLASPVCEKITAVKHCNGKDVWVVAHGWNDDTYISYLVTSAGVTAIPIISHSGAVIGGNVDGSLGYMKSSPDGKKLAAAHNLVGLELSDFNTSTGVVSSTVNLFQATDNFSNCYGVEFSVDAKRLYVTASDYSLNLSQHHNYLVQYDISASNLSQIVASKEILTSDNFAAQTFGALQLGPDGKIYMTAQVHPNLSVIDYPNERGGLCGLRFNEISVGSGRFCQFGLRTFVQSFFYDYFTVMDQCDASKVEFYYSVPDNVQSIKWDFGDGASGGNNFSDQDTTSHIFSSPGIYNVQLIRYRLCGNDTLQRIVEVFDNTVNLGRDTIVCGAEGFQLLPTNTGPNLEYLWSDGSSGPLLLANTSGTHWLQVRNVVNGCVSRDSIDIILAEYPSFTLGQDQAKCAGEIAVLTPGLTGVTYYWSDGSTNPTLAAVQSGLYWVEATNNTCSKRDSINILFNPSPNIKLGEDTLLCRGNTLLLQPDAINANLFWQDNSSGPNFLVTTAGTYWVTATLGSCTSIDSISEYLVMHLISL